MLGLLGIWADNQYLVALPQLENLRLAAAEKGRPETRNNQKFDH